MENANKQRAVLMVAATADPGFRPVVTRGTFREGTFLINMAPSSTLSISIEDAVFLANEILLKAKEAGHDVR